jgi:hypothetical protein
MLAEKPQADAEWDGDYLVMGQQEAKHLIARLKEQVDVEKSEMDEYEPDDRKLRGRSRPHQGSDDSEEGELIRTQSHGYESPGGPIFGVFKNLLSETRVENKR